MEQGPLQSKRYETFQVGAITLTGASAARPALPGDTVIVSEGKVTTLVKREQHKGLVGVLELASPTRYGFTARGTPIYLFVPWNESYPPFYVGSTHADTSKNVLAVVDFESWEATANCPRGSCRQILGPCGDLNTEEKALLLAARPNPWKLNSLPKLEAPMPPYEGGYKCLGPTFHVDPEGCRDIDDAITIVKKGDIITLKIHIADVASYLLTNPWLIEPAAAKGQTLYKDGVVVAGLFPPSVEAACSLLPFHPRMTITLKVVFEDYEGMLIVREKSWRQEEITVEESYTYETIMLSDHAELLKELSSALAFRDLSDSHDWIEQLMVTYNTEFGVLLKEAGEGILRRHAAPDWNLLSTLESLRHVPPYVAYRAGEYCATTDSDTSHYTNSGLTLDTYCHASSPIRRWADCMNQLYIHKYLFDHNYPIPNTTPESLNSLAKVAKEYERNSFFVRLLLGQAAAAPSEIHGTILQYEEDHPSKKVKAWISKWNRIQTFYPPLEGWSFQPAVGMQIKASFFYDASLRNWKRRMVFRVTPVCPLQDEFLSVNTFVRPESAFSIDSYVPEESGAESRKIDGTEDGSGSLTF